MLHLHIIVLAGIASTVGIVALILAARFWRQWPTKKGSRIPGYSYITYDKPEDWSGFLAPQFIGWIAVALLMGVVISLIPFQPKYWFITQHEGTIATLSNRFVEGTGDLSGSTFTLTLEGDPTPLVVTDSRILGLAVGGTVDLTCSVEWVYGGADVNHCVIRSFTEAD